MNYIPNGTTVKITKSSHNRHKVGEIGTIKHHAFDLYDFIGEDGYHSLFSPDEFETINNSNPCQAN